MAKQVIATGKAVGPPKVIVCVCTHAYQDERYGKGKRLANPLGKSSAKGQEYRCTVCSRITL